MQTSVITPAEADRLAARLLGDLRTKLGGLQIAHARRVASGLPDMADRMAFTAALLHDVIEKGRSTPEELLALTGDAGVVAAVGVLTQRAGETDYDYLSRCAADPIALAIKRLDLMDKFVADDSTVAAQDGELIRRRAGQRLALLDRLALRNAD